MLAALTCAATCTTDTSTKPTDSQPYRLRIINVVAILKAMQVIRNFEYQQRQILYYGSEQSVYDPNEIRTCQLPAKGRWIGLNFQTTT